jgi:hypothetical protein
MQKVKPIKLFEINGDKNDNKGAACKRIGECDLRNTIGIDT